jgi:hypothetical protein
MGSSISIYIIDERLLSIYKKKKRDRCYDQHCNKKINVGDEVVSRMVSKGYNGKFRVRFHKNANRTYRVLYHKKCAMELNII